MNEYSDYRFLDRNVNFMWDGMAFASIWRSKQWHVVEIGYAHFCQIIRNYLGLQSWNSCCWVMLHSFHKAMTKFRESVWPTIGCWIHTTPRIAQRTWSFNWLNVFSERTIMNCKVYAHTKSIYTLTSKVYNLKCFIEWMRVHALHIQIERLTMNGNKSLKPDEDLVVTGELALEVSSCSNSCVKCCIRLFKIKLRIFPTNEFEEFSAWNVPFAHTSWPTRLQFNTFACDVTPI